MPHYRTGLGGRRRERQSLRGGKRGKTASHTLVPHTTLGLRGDSAWSFVNDRVLTTSPEACQPAHHGLELIRSMPGPVPQLRQDANGPQASVGTGGVTRESFVGDMRIIFDSSGRFHNVDPSRHRPGGQFGTLRRGVQSLSDVDVAQCAAALEFRGVSSRQQLSRNEPGFGSMQVGPSWYIANGVG